MTNPLDHHFLLGARHTAEVKAAADASYLATHGDTGWKINNSSWADYSEGVYFPELGQTLDEVVSANTCDSKVGIDIAGGSNATAMLDLLRNGVLERAAVTNFEDRRPDTVRVDSRLEHISGNLLFEETWRKIFAWRRQVAPDGLKLALHEPRNTLQWLKAKLYLKAAHALIGNIAPEGLLASQIPLPLSTGEVKDISTELSARRDVAGLFISEEYRGVRQALVVKTS